MIFKLTSYEHVSATDITVSLRCPACRQIGTFESVNSYDLRLMHPVGGGASEQRLLGQRRCPNAQCKAHVFLAMKGGSGEIVVSYPPERIDFDATNIPQPVLAALEEAITCHASSCFIAAAIMVRKALEELCRDRGATGANLKDRVRSLSTRVLLTQELMDGLDDLRLLGNDAAHIEAQVFDQVGKEEVEVGIEVTKEVLKAVYQYSALIDKLRGLKRNS